MSNANSVAHKVSTIIDRASRKDQKERLQKWNEICQELIEGATHFTIALAVKNMVNNGYAIKKQTVYNPGNAYREIFDLYANTRKSKRVRVSSDPDLIDDTYINEIDLRTINDQVTRYQVSLLLGQMKSCQKQLGMLKDIRNAQQIHVVGDQFHHSPKENSQAALLTDHEITILKELYESSKFRFDSNGKMIAKFMIKTGEAISSEGMKVVFKKILTSYHAL